MALIRWQATVQDDAGNAVVNPSVTVRNASDNSLATIYNNAGASLANPFTGTPEGFVSFNAVAGEYIIQGAKGGSNAPDWRIVLNDVDKVWTSAEMIAHTTPFAVGQDTIKVNVTDEVIFYVRQPGAGGPEDITAGDGSSWAKASLTNYDVTVALAAAMAAVEFPIVASGTFTPTVTFETPGTLSVVYGGTQRGEYNRFGNVVKCNVNLNTATITKGTASGKLRFAFDDLPYTPGALSMGSGRFRFVNALFVPPAGAVDLNLVVVQSQKYMEVGYIRSIGGNLYMDTTHIPDGAYILQFSFEFTVA